MSAKASDLASYYGESLVGFAEAIAATNGGVRNANALERGRYAIRYRAVAGSTTVWLRQGGADVTATAAYPNHPFDFALAPDGRLATVIVAQPDRDGFFAAITNAGTVEIVLERISREW